MTPHELAPRAFADGVTSRRFAATLGLSIALHAALLAGLPDFRSYTARPAAAPLNARLEPGARALAAPEPRTAAMAPAERSAPAALAAAARKPAPAARVSAPDRAEPIPPAAPAHAPAAIASATSAGTSAGTNEATNRPAAAARDDAPPLALGTPTLAPRTGDDALDPGSLAQYRLALIGAARRHKIYPPLAIDRALEGRAEIRLVFGGEGRLAAALVKRSSGHELLDRQALETLREASAVTPIPPALRSREFAVEVPILYELKTAR